MPFDETKDDVLDEALIEIDDAQSYIHAKLAAYSGGEPKIQLTRFIKLGNGEKKYAKLGRLTRAESRALIPILQQWAFDE